MTQSRRSAASMAVLVAVACLVPRAGSEPAAGGVEPAIQKGVEYLRARVKAGLPEIMDTARVKVEALHGGQSYNEIVLYTLLTAGVPKEDPDVVKLVEDIRAKPLVHTYGTALRAQAFEKCDPLLFRLDIKQCGQFLVDNQGKKGAWGYSKAVELPPLPKVTITPSERPVASGTGGSLKPGPSSMATDRQTKALPKTVLQRRDWGEERDNSNTQYAMLGLAACSVAGIHPPADVYALCEQWLTACQNTDGGWGYRSGEKEPSYGSMTAGGVSSLSICLRARHQDPAKDVRVKKGLEWLAQNLAFDSHPSGDKKWQFYWIYSVERAGAFSGVEKIGDKSWYAAGTGWILANQKPDGSWEADDKNKTADTICDTCWALLFLKQASRHYVISGG